MIYTNTCQLSYFNKTQVNTFLIHTNDCENILEIYYVHINKKKRVEWYKHFSLSTIELIMDDLFF